MGWSASSAVLVDNTTIEQNVSGQLQIKNGGVTNDIVAALAGIVYSKLNLTNGIVNADIAAAAAIVYSKLNLTNSIVNADIAAGAAIAKSKLAALAIVNSDVDAAAAIAYSKLNLASSITNADISASAGIAFSKLAALTSGNILVGNASNVPTAVAMSGDGTLSNAGVFGWVNRSLKFNSNQSPSAATAWSFGSLSGDKDYAIYFHVKKTTATTGQLFLRFNGVSTASYHDRSSVGTGVSNRVNQAEIQLWNDPSTGSGNTMSGWIFVSNQWTNNNRVHVFCVMGGDDVSSGSGNVCLFGVTSGGVPSGGVTSIDFLRGSSATYTGTFTLFDVARA